MASSITNMEAIKPVLLKVGIPLSISVASLIFTRMALKKRSIWKISSSFGSQAHDLESKLHQTSGDKESVCRLDSTSTSCQGVDHLQVECELAEEISGAKIRIEDLQEKVWQLEMRFIRYQDSKEREVMLMDLQNKLLLEITSIEFMEREILSMEAESQRIGNMVIDYSKIIELLQLSRSENQLLHKRVMKLFKKMRGYSSLLEEKSLQIEAKETKISRTQKELETRVVSIENLEDEIRELKMAVEQLQREKEELSSKLDLAEKSASTKIDGEVIRVEDYNKLVDELEQLQKDREIERKELVFLRWCQACLRYKLMRRNEEEQDEMEVKNEEEMLIEENVDQFAEFGSDNEVDSSSLVHSDNCLGFPIRGGHVHGHSRRRKLIEKLKRWVDGSEKLKEGSDIREKQHEHKFFRRHLVSKGADNLVVPARKSCSSA